MNDPFQRIFELNFKNSLFQPNSRYYGINTAQLNTSSDKTIIYLRRRFAPSPERFSTLQEHTVMQGDRLDTIAGKYLGDPELFWRICDANGAIRPDDLIETISRTLRITLPEGIQGIKNG